MKRTIHLQKSIRVLRNNKLNRRVQLQTTKAFRCVLCRSERKRWECSHLFSANPARNGRLSSFPATFRNRLRRPSRSKGSSLRLFKPQIPPVQFGPLTLLFPLHLPFFRSSFFTFTLYYHHFLIHLDPFVHISALVYLKLASIIFCFSLGITFFVIIGLLHVF